MKNLETLSSCCEGLCRAGAGILDGISRLPKEPNAAEVSVARCFFVGQIVKVYSKKKPYPLKGEMEIVKVPHPNSRSNVLHFKDLIKNIKVGDFLVVTSQ